MCQVLTQKRGWGPNLSSLPPPLRANVSLYRRFEASDLHPYVTSETLQEFGLAEYWVDTFASDYDDYVDEFGFELDAPCVGSTCNNVVSHTGVVAVLKRVLRLA